jgi:hypothetical protein
MLNPAFTDILCISCINSIQCSKPKKRAWCPWSKSALNWKMCDSKFVQNYEATIVAPTQRDQHLLSSKGRAYFQTHEWSWNKLNFGHMSWRCLKLRTILLARNSSNLLDCSRIMRTGEPMIHSLFSVWVWFFWSPHRPDRSWGPPSLLSNWGQGVQLTTHLRLVPKWRMVGLYHDSPMFSWHGA